MKKIILLLAISAFVFTAQAKLWRVNNIAGLNANFISFTAAQASASANDTLYFEGSTTSYGDITLTKPLVIVGPGYFLTENQQTQANIISTTFGSITLSTGSSGSIITGLIVTGTIEIKVGNISIISNKTSSLYINNSLAFGNVLISKNYTNGSISGGGSNGSQVYNVIITNNYVSSGIGFNTPYSGIFSNNILNQHYSFSVHNFTINSNIFIGDNNSSATDNVFYNNIGSGTQFPIGNGNQQNVDMTNVFVGVTGNSTDGQWKLKAYSPALGTGMSGVDCGIFGGSSPYVLSGLPSIPAIYEITMPTTGDNINGIDVTIKAKTH